MAIHSIQNQQTFPGSNSTGPFVLPFPFYKPEDLTLTILDNVGNPTYLDLGSDYRVSGAGQGRGGAITLTQPLLVGQLLIVIRETDPTQQTVYQEGSDFPAQAHERALDKLTMLHQDQSRNVDRALKVPLLNRTVLSTEIQNIGANRLLMFTSDASGIIARNVRDAVLDQTGGAINVPITLINHGFTVGQVLAQAGANLALANASEPLLSEVVGIVSAIESEDRFTLTTTGQVTCFSGLVPGLPYFLSDTLAGSISPVEPLTPGFVSKPILIASSATTAYLYNYRGKLNPDSTISGGHNVVYDVSLVAHGFTPGQVLYFDAINEVYALAKADAVATSEVVGIVGDATADEFSLVTAGYVDNLTGLTPGTLFLSDTVAGSLSPTEPVTVGHISKPIFECVSPSSGFFINYRGNVIPDPNQASASSSTYPNPTTATSNTTAKPNSTVRTYSSQTTPLQITLPNDFQADDTLRVLDANGKGWAIIQGSGQQVFCAGDPNPSQTTLGATGQVTSNNAKYSFIELTCVDAGQTFVVTGMMGNLGFV